MGRIGKFEGLDVKYLTLLAETYPDINAACTEIINLRAIMNLPKGTEHFVSDVHGEYDAFNHVLRHASGVIKTYIDEIFGNTVRENEKLSLATLIYYPEQKVALVEKEEENIQDWYRITLFRLIRICKRVSSKYSRSKVRKSLPQDFAYILEELIHEDADRIHKHEYYNEIVETIANLDRAPAFIIAISKLIQRLAIDHLHVIGDIFDRGPAPEKIMDLLMNYHSADVQWGNHDISWMGAASGSLACICNVIRISAKYNNLHVLEEGYGINLVPLATFAISAYAGDPCRLFRPADIQEGQGENEIDLITKMHKAITILQFKAEGQVIKRNPSYGMEERLLLDKINPQDKTVLLNGEPHPLSDGSFPTIDWADPYAFTPEEEEVANKLTGYFMSGRKLNEHARFLFNKGSMYKVYNDNLLYHGVIPLNEDGAFKEVLVNGKWRKGKELYDEIETMVRAAYFMNNDNPEKIKGQDMMWYLWCGPGSPLFGKKRMTTFERYFASTPETIEEEKDYYYVYRDKEETCKQILAEFGLDPNTSRIINGHVPVKVKKGESPVKAGGKLLVIDGGFSHPYQKVTGIAGYTLVYNSKGLVLTSHEPFTSMQDVIKNDRDVVCNSTPLDITAQSKKVKNTDVGVILDERIKDLEALVKAYRRGLVKEKL